MSVIPSTAWSARITRALTGARAREAFIVFLVAVVVLIPGMTWGIPSATGPAMIRGWDVDGIGGIGVLSELNHLRGGNTRGWYVAYPVFHYILLGVAYLPYLGSLIVTGGLQAPSPLYPFGLRDPVSAIATLHLITRIVSVVMAAGTVLLAYLTVRRNGDRRDAWVAAFAILLAEPLIFYAHTGNLDVPVLFWCAASICCGAAIIEDGLTPSRAIIAGIAGGIAVATKDQAYAVMVPMGAYVAWRSIVLAPAAQRATAIRRVVLLVAVALVTFAFAGGLVLWPGRFIMHVRYMLDFEQSFANVRHPTFLTVLRPPGVGGIPALLGDVAHATSEAMGLPLALLAAAATIMMLLRVPMTRLLAFAALGVFLLSVVPVRHMQYRYALFPVWALAVGLGVAGRAVRGRVKANGRNVVLRRGWYAVVVLSLLIEGGRGVDLMAQQRGDARYAAASWAASRMSPGDEVGFFGGTHQLPHLPSGVSPVWLFGEDQVAVQSVYERQFRWIVAAADYFSAESRDHSAIMPDSVWRDLNDGRAGYRLAGRFETPSLLGRSPYYLPYVNSPVRIFERAGPPLAPRRAHSPDAPPF